MNKIVAPSGMFSCEIWGYRSTRDEALDLQSGSQQQHLAEKRRYIKVNNTLNALSYFLSPIIGIIRIIISAILIKKDQEKKEALDPCKKHLIYKAQIKRGVGEIFGGGALFWIIDCIGTSQKGRTRFINWQHYFHKNSHVKVEINQAL